MFVFNQYLISVMFNLYEINAPKIEQKFDLDSILEANNG